jgi:acetyl esterase/lipase
MNQEIAAIREMLKGLDPSMELPQLRAWFDGMGDQVPLAADVTAQAVDAGGVPAEWTETPGAARNRVILYLHGGGYVIGSLASHRHMVSELGRAAGARTLAIHYRLSPENACPAPVEDAVKAYRFLLAQGIKPGDIAVAGDSAGGGLTVATLVGIREAGLPQPACGVCISPWVDMEGTGATMDTKAAEDPMVQKAGLLGMAAAYLQGQDPRTPAAAPLYADLTGIAPLLIQVGTTETLLDDSIRLASHAGAAGVKVTLDTWPEMIHVWHLFHPILTDGRKAIAAAGAYAAAAMNEAADLKKVA